MQGPLAPVWRHYNTLTLQYDIFLILFIPDHPEPDKKTCPLPLDLIKEYPNYRTWLTPFSSKVFICTSSYVVLAECFTNWLKAKSQFELLQPWQPGVATAMLSTVVPGNVKGWPHSVAPSPETLSDVVDIVDVLGDVERRGDFYSLLLFLFLRLWTCSDGSVSMKERWNWMDTALIS